MQTRNPHYNEHGDIDLELEHPVHGWIPYTASPADTEQLGRDLFAAHQATAGLYVPPPAPTAAQLQSMALSALAAHRWKVENGGTTWNGRPVHTDRDSRSAAMGEIMNINAGLRQDGDLWKFADGHFRPLTNSEFMQMYAAAGQFVRLCFACEAICQARIAAGNYSIAQIWAEEWADLTGA